MTKDQVLIRAKDVTLLISILTLLGLLFGPMRKVFMLEQTIDDVAGLKKDVGDDKTAIAVINSQYADINSQLKEIKWQLRGMNNDRR